MSSNYRMSRCVALALVVSGLAAQPASALRGDVGESAASAAQARVPLVVTKTETGDASHGGFDWGDAGIGAAAMLGLTGIGAGALIVGRRRRPTRTVAMGR
ncbi:MAG TPA: hypothetical protein VD790_04460 [Thermoleophilaceae bacterium]|nr:hypothetical protein [Thermoleophilaceae bacterium]